MHAFMRVEGRQRAAHESAGTRASAPVVKHQSKTDDARVVEGVGDASRFAHDFSRAPVRVQRKLAVGAHGDQYEQEAERASALVMGLAGPKLTGGCGCQGSCAKCGGGGQLSRSTRPLVQPKREPSGAGGEQVSSPLVDDVLSAPGQPLDAGARAFMEPRFGHDFSSVRVHADDKAAESARTLGALAYTAGRHVVFGGGQYRPDSAAGRYLLAHELAHVAQQGADERPHRISRFSDTDHLILEEAALALSELGKSDDERLKDEELKQIHEGNKQRDYSQTGKLPNLALLCEFDNFGGYEDHEHFDDFGWNEELQKWQSRKASAGPTKRTPVQYIEDELVGFVGELPKKTAFRRVGNAFHTVEDFFAHSNFVDLTHGDFTHGRDLITGSVGGPDLTSVLKIGESVSGFETAPFYGQQAARETAKTPPGSHARVAKDYKSSPYHTEALVLAALVIRELGADIVALRSMTDKEAQTRYVREVIMARLGRYLRPPDRKDPWWETLQARGGRQMEKNIREIDARTPVTKNQCFLSLLKSIEASRDSNMKLFGPTFTLPTKHGHVFIQVGAGGMVGPAFKNHSLEVEPRKVEPVIGFQLTGRF